MRVEIIESVPLNQPVNQEMTEALIFSAAPLASAPPDSKKAIRTSLWASTLDGVFATIFTNVAGGVLLSNFLVELNASPTQIGLLSSIPMLANLLQPIGAILSERSTSRHNYCLGVYAPARLLWLILVVGILWGWRTTDPQLLIKWTLATVCVTHFVGALGSASWLSWLAVLVPRRLRGRYFGIRNSAASLTSLLCVPILGWMVSAFPGGSIQGYGVVLLLGVVTGIISLGFQFFMVDVNPQVQNNLKGKGDRASITSSPETNSPEANSSENTETEDPITPLFRLPAFLLDRNFLLFLLYLSFWMFAVNLSAPFFNVYLLDNLVIDLQAVTLYNSLQAGANLLLLLVWGKIADRVGNRAVLITVGILVAITPLLWLGTGNNVLSIWLVFPLLHILGGGTWAAIDLCINNLQLGVAPVRTQASYFAIAAAVAGVSGALGTTAGGFLAEFADYGGIPGLFALSAIVRLVALLPLLWVQEQHGQSLRQIMGMLFSEKDRQQREAESQS
ncbi:MAG TPA: MFS transporter [Thermosynechococcaceae cyanobacterium]